MKSARAHAVPSGPATPQHPPVLFWLQADEGCVCAERKREIGQEKNGLRSERMDVCYVLRVLRAEAEEGRAADN